MNVFENLIDELKEENLLEETVIQTADAERRTADLTNNVIEADTVLARQNADTSTVSVQEDADAKPELFQNDYSENNLNSQPVSDAEFYRKRALDEVAFLQMVESAFAGVEREQMKIVPKPYDDLEVKKVLHSFLQNSGDVSSTQHAQAEFQLLQETESWYSALSHRDKRISTAHLRRYCENSRPPLSTPALVALARFYRNAPYSEQARSKFDLIITRLFSKEHKDSRRIMNPNRDEIIEKLQNYYAEWSSVPLYSTDENDSEILLTTLRFEDFMSEVEAAESFDELLKNDFFNRLRVFKENTDENFFAPLISATAIECNVRVGDRFLDLLESERGEKDLGELEDKYGFMHDQSISEAVSKTLEIASLLASGTENSQAEEHKSIEKEPLPVVNAESKPQPKAKVKSEPSFAGNILGVNKWLLVAAVLSVLASFAIYYWTEAETVDVRSASSVQTLNLENPAFKNHLKIARGDKETLFGVVLPNWNHFTDEKKEEAVRQISAAGSELGYKKVYLLDSDGKAVASAADGAVIVKNTH